MALSPFVLITLTILRASVLAEAGSPNCLARCECKKIPGRDELETKCSLEDFQKLTTSILRPAEIQSL